MNDWQRLAGLYFIGQPLVWSAAARYTLSVMFLKQLAALYCFRQEHEVSMS
jgi:hypothetical protein